MSCKFVRSSQDRLVRIIAGRFRRRKLLTNEGLTTRPITDRVKESVFNLLADEIEDRRVADVFAGTGTLGLEALSRGAAGVVFIEQDRRAVALLKRNVDALGVEDETLCWRNDVERSSFRPKGVPHLTPFDLVFFDPPYRMVEDVVPGRPLYKSLERLAREDVTSPAARLLFRTPAGAEYELPSAWETERTQKLAGMQIAWCRKSSRASDDVSTRQAADHPLHFENRDRGHHT